MATLINELHEIEVALISFDSLNPRGETEEQIVTDDSFDKLKDSIRDYGVMEPIIIRKDKNAKNEAYILVDGERRFHAVKDLKLDKIPALIAEKDIDGRAIAYQIHMNRKPWSRAAEAKAIKLLIQDMIEENPDITEILIKKKLKEITNHKSTAINEFLDIIKYHDSAIDKVMSNKLQQSYLTRIEQDFTIPLLKNYSTIVDDFGIDKIRSIMIVKAENGLLKDTRYMMTNSDFKKIFQDKIHEEKIAIILSEFLLYSDKSIIDLTNNYQKIIDPESVIIDNNSKNNGSTTQLKPIINYPVDQIITPDKTITENQNELSQRNNENQATIEEIPTPIKVKKQNQTTVQDVRNKYEKIGKKLTSEEFEYIREAIRCLELNCFKASVLMIWSAAISRILDYISNDIQKYNSESATMQAQNRSFYKHHSKAFQTKAKTIDDVKETAKDMQYLCYICFEQLITQSNFKKFKGHYDIRNDCAHPTSVVILQNEALSIFENIYEHIFNNPKL